MKTRIVNVKGGRSGSNGNGTGNGRKTGVVKWFSQSKGYGFIAIDSGGDAFVHYSAIESEESLKNLYEGQRVMFVVTDRGRGPQAQEVRLEGYG